MDMQKLYRFPVLIIMMFFIYSPYAGAQLQRNPVLEYCTGTWCGYCPCGHTIIKDQIIPAYPNTVIISYHVNSSTVQDPYSGFSGNSVVSLLGYTGVPTGVIDRTSPPISRGSWYNAVSSRNAVNATVDININKTFNEATRQLDLTVYATALVNLTGSYNVTAILVEDGLVYSQVSYSGCPAGGADYKHDDVVRSMLNGALGEKININDSWAQNELVQKSYTFTIPAGLSYNSCEIKIFVYKVSSPLNVSEIQQAKQWALPGTIVPVELSSFTASVDNKSIILDWETVTEVNNQGFTIERSTNGENYIPVGFIKGNGTTLERKYYSFKDAPEVNGIYYYRLRQQDYNGSIEYSEVLTVKLDIPADFMLGQNYPNPFNPSTTISFAIPVQSHVSLRVYDVMGREVSLLIDENKSAGIYDIGFDASGLSSGTYFYKLTAGNFSQIKKLVVIK
jgi:hypothetical protein